MNRVAVGPIAWVNDDLRDWGTGRTAAEVLQQISAAGYDGTENSYVFPQDPLQLKDTLAQHNLVLAAAYRWTNFSNPGLQAEEIRLACEHVDFCRQAGAGFATLAEGGGSLHWDARGPAASVTPLDAAGSGRLVASLHEVGRYARDSGMQLSIHPHGGTAVESPAETAALLDRLDPELVGWCLDTGHVAYGGGNSAELLDRFADRVVYVHLKDVRGQVLERVRAEGLTFAEAVRLNVFCTPGTGMLDFDPVMERLRDYRGWLVIEAEQDPAVHDAFTVSRDARQFLKERYGI